MYHFPMRSLAIVQLVDVVVIIHNIDIILRVVEQMSLECQVIFDLEQLLWWLMYQLRCCPIDCSTLRSRRFTIPIFGNWLYRIWYNSSTVIVSICCMNDPDIIIMKPNEGALIVSSLSHLISSSYYLQCSHTYPVISCSID